MAVKLNIVVQDKGVSALFKRLQQRLADTRPVMADLGERVKGSVQRNFDEEGRPVKWARLKLGTILSWAGRKKTFFTKKGSFSKKGQAAIAGRKILTDTGALRRSISSRATHNQVDVFTRKKYAIFHQEGTRRMPARKFMMVQPEDWKYFIGRWSAYLQ